MKIAVDVTTLATPDADRGLGLTLSQWFQSISQWDLLNEFVWVKSLGNDQVQCSPTGLSAFRDAGPGFVWEDPTSWAHALGHYNIDIVHFPNVLMANIPLPNAIARPYVCTVNDLIPLKLREMYLDKWGCKTQADYHTRLSFISRALALFAASEQTKADIASLLNYPENDIFLVTHHVRSSFRNPMPSPRPALPRPYIFAPSGYDPRKNNIALIRAFALFQTSFPQYSLVISGIWQTTERDELHELGRSVGVSDKHIIFLDHISDSALRTVYEHATVVVFISLYEGFGLPAIEAFECGVPLVCSNTSAVAEIADDAALRVDPTNPVDIATSLVRLVADPALLAHLAFRGNMRRDAFTANRTRFELLHAYRAVEARLAYGSAPRPRPKVAFFSPLNPMPSGISDYSESLIAHLIASYDVTLFVDGFTPSNGRLAELPRIDYQGISHNALMEILESFDLALYHIGNNVLHRHIVRIANEFPGVVVLHDVNLHGLFFHITHLEGDTLGFIQVMHKWYGEPGRKAAIQECAGGAADVEAFPLSLQAIEHAKLVIVHSEWARHNLISQGFPPQKVCVIPSGMSLPLLKGNPIDEDCGRFTVGCFGDVNPRKQPDVVIEGFAKFVKTAPCPNALLRFVGHPEASLQDSLRRVSINLGIEHQVEFLGRVPLSQFNAYIQASDVVVNLRYPHFGETSASLLRGLAYGRPIIATAVGPFQEFPDDFVWKTSPGPTQTDQLAGILLELYGNYPLRSMAYEAARNYLALNHEWNKVAHLYRQALTGWSEARGGSDASSLSRRRYNNP